MELPISACAHARTIHAETPYLPTLRKYYVILLNAISRASCALRVENKGTKMIRTGMRTEGIAALLMLLIGSNAFEEIRKN